MSIGGESPETGFSGHFSGNGHRIRIESEGVQNRNGLFASLSGAQVTDLELEVVQSNKGTGIAGALTSHAQNSRIEHVTVRQTVTAGTRRSAGLVGYSENSWIGDCKVLSSGPEYAEYGGLAYRNAGTIENCEYVTDGKSAKLSKFGGMTYENYGRIAECTATVRNSADSEAEPQHIVISGSNVGGIVGLLVGGTVTGCAANLNIEENPEKLALYGLGGIAGLAGTEEAELSRREDIVIENCRSYGGVLTGERWIGGILGGSQASLTQNLTILNCTVDLVKLESFVNKENDVRPPDLDGVGSTIALGGILGMANVKNATRVEDCVNNASVYGHHVMGGLVGVCWYQDSGGTSDLYSLSVVNSHCYAQEVGANEPTGYGAGGFVSHIGKSDKDASGSWSTTFLNCTSYADVRGYGSFLGGAVGYYQAAENLKAADDYHFRNCHSYGNVIAISTGNGFGGFFGEVSTPNLKVADCSANGAVTAKKDDGNYGVNVGGFAGRSVGEGAVFERCLASGNVFGKNGAGGFAARIDSATLRNCTSKGSVSGWYHSGGFVGYTSGTTIEDCDSYGDAVIASNCNQRYYVGGFVGIAQTSGSFARCRAYGAVSEFVNYGGGFVGYVQNVAAGKSVTFADCASYGDVSKQNAAIGSYTGGFAGCANVDGSVTFKGCTAYGDVKGMGGFIGYLYTKEGASFTDCHAYGDVWNDAHPTGELGGFGGFIRGIAELTTFTDCTSRGNVQHTSESVAQPGGADAGGFLGVLAAKSKLLRCRSYASKIVGEAIYSGAFIATLLRDDYGNAEGSIMQDCTYTAPGSLPMIGTASAGYFTTTQTNNKVDTADYAGQNPRPSLSCTVTKGNGTDAVVTFSGAANIAGYVTELSVSTDGGKTYTQLVYTDIKRGYDGYLLVPLGGKAAGESKLTAGNFSFTVSSRSAVAAGSIGVRVAFSGGYAKTFTA